MKGFITKRFLSSIITLLILSLIIFVLVRASGDPAELLYEYPGAREEDIARQAAAWGLDRSWPEQYVSFIWNVVRFDYGQSFQYGTSVRSLYFDRLPNSLQLAFCAFVISLAIGIPLGIMSAVKVNTWWDGIGKTIALLGLSVPSFFVALLLVCGSLETEAYGTWLPFFGQLPILAFCAFVISLAIGIPLGIMSAVKVNTWWDGIGKTIALLGLSVPSFFVALLLVLVFGVKLEWLPFLGKADTFFDWQHLTLPAVSLGWFFSGAMLRLTRSSMLEVLGSEYIKLCRLKGLPETAVIVKHAFKNSFIPDQRGGGGGSGVLLAWHWPAVV